MKSRESACQSILQGSYDVCIIGGGATGLGCALDAQLRGFSTVLLDAGDFVSHTSMSSTKLVHGGVRYLQQAVRELDRAQFALVGRALHERMSMLRRAPFLAHPLELLVPCFSLWELAYYTTGMKLYDWIAGSSSLFPSRILGREETLQRMPGLRHERRNGQRSQPLVGSVSYADGQFDDARFGIALAQTFAQQGGELINYANAIAFTKDSSGKLTDLEVEDQLTGQRFQIRAKVFLNCTGPFADQLRRMANPRLPERLRLSKGVHLLLPLEALQSDAALLIPRTDDGRVIFAIPWLGRLLVGTTDDEATLADEMVVTPEEVHYLLHHVNQYLNETLTPQDVQSAFAGLRPLLKSKPSLHTGNLVRDHEVELDPASGLISVMGGKWTTYRAMAEDAIDCVQLALGVEPRECRTLDFPLSGAEGFWVDYWRQLAEKYDLSSRSARHLAQKFGTDAPKVLELAEQDPQLLQPLVPGGAAIGAEAVYAIREEMAQTIEDILARRLGVQFHSWSEAAESAPVVAQWLAREFAWSEDQTRQAVAAYLGTLRHLLHAAGIENQPETTGGR
jgi:glycerol-3-phosphate dehydrogenase